MNTQTTHPRRPRGLPLPLAGTMILALMAGCSETPAGVDNPGETPAEVGQYLTELPSWSTFTADVNGPDQPPTPAGPPVSVGADTASVEMIEEDGSVTLLPDVVYQCTEQPYTMAANPTELVMYDPDVEILWPGGLIQGRSRKSLGSFEALPIAERAPLRVSIPSFAFAENFREVAGPNQATVGAAVGAIIGDATGRGIRAPSAIEFELDSYYSEEAFALSVDLSGKYLGFSGSVGVDIDRRASETTLTAHYIQRMFTVVVEGGQSPGAFFSSDFTQEKLQEQINQGRMGPDNLPIYVSNIVYGRMMMFSITSTASRSEIEGTLNAAYRAVAGEVELNLTAKQQKILETAKIEVTSRGGDARNILDVIRSGDWSQYFTDDAPLSTAAPLSYTLRNLGDNSIAGVTESTEYNIRSCDAIPASPGSFSFMDGQTQAPPFTGGVETLTGDVNGDGRVDLIWNQLSSTLGNNLYVGLSAGDGTFQFTAPFSHPEDPAEGWSNYTVQVADINGDAYADLVWNHLDVENKTYVGLGVGDGSFGTPAARIHSANGWGAYDLLIGDAMGPTGSRDGLDDLNFVRWNTATIGIYGGMSLGNSQFEWQPWWPSGGGSAAGYGLHKGDLNGDGAMDAFFTNLTSGRTYPVWSGGDGDWTLGSASDPGGDRSNYAVRVGPVTPNGPDALILVDSASLTTNDITTGVWNGAGFTYTHTTGFAYRGPSDPPLVVAVGDVDADGDTDVIWSRRAAGVNRTWVSLSRGDGTYDFSADQSHPETGENWSQFRMYVADVNGDGLDDIIWNHAAGDNKIYVALGRS